MLKRVVRRLVDARGDRGADDGRVGCVLGKKEYDVCSSFPQSLSVAESDLMKVSQSNVMLGASPRKIRSMDVSGARRVAGTGSGVAIEPQFDEQVVCQDLTGELSNSLFEIRKETPSWKTKWRHVCVRQLQTKVIDSRVLSRA